MKACKAKKIRESDHQQIILPSIAAISITPLSHLSAILAFVNLYLSSTAIINSRFACISSAVISRVRASFHTANRVGLGVGDVHTHVSGDADVVNDDDWSMNTLTIGCGTCECRLGGKRCS